MTTRAQSHREQFTSRLGPKSYRLRAMVELSNGDAGQESEVGTLKFDPYLTAF